MKLSIDVVDAAIFSADRTVIDAEKERRQYFSARVSKLRRKLNRLIRKFFNISDVMETEFP